MNPKIKNTLIAVIIIVVMFFGYRYFFVGDGPVPALSVTGAVSNPADQAGRDFLDALINLKHINLDSSALIFSDQAFARLKDMSVALPVEPRGRTNPFKAIGDDSGSSGTTTPAILPAN